MKGPKYCYRLLLSASIAQTDIMAGRECKTAEHQCYIHFEWLFFCFFCQYWSYDGARNTESYIRLKNKQASTYTRSRQDKKVFYLSTLRYSW